MIHLEERKNSETKSNWTIRFMVKDKIIWENILAHINDEINLAIKTYIFNAYKKLFNEIREKITNVYCDNLQEEVDTAVEKIKEYSS